MTLGDKVIGRMVSDSLREPHTLMLRGYTGGPPQSVPRYIDCCRCDRDNLERNESAADGLIGKDARALWAGIPSP
jgi:hypothetical protein